MPQIRCVFLLTHLKSLIGGVLMFAVGTLYLIAERTLLASSRTGKKVVAATMGDAYSRAIIGAQVR